MVEITWSYHPISHVVENKAPSQQTLKTGSHEQLILGPWLAQGASTLIRTCTLINWTARPVSYCLTVQQCQGVSTVSK